MKKLLITLAITTLVGGCLETKSDGPGEPWTTDTPALGAPTDSAKKEGAPKDGAEPSAPVRKASAKKDEAAKTPDRAEGGGLRRGDPTYVRKSLSERKGWDPRFRKGCELLIRTVWAETRRGRYIIEAQSKTESCVDIELSIAIRAPNQRVIYRSNYKAAEVYGFTKIKRPTDIRGALIDWATNYGSLNKRSDRLPYWPRGARTPTVRGKYPFTADKTWDRPSYLELRRAKLPVYCHVHDLDSMNCVILNDFEQKVRPLGVQKFPTTTEKS
ncbi:MAG: hypothetical protein MRY74_02950 [Neomegalonema sp.]|nr:hypothetical protein [Neomegalonema sp.]